MKTNVLFLVPPNISYEAFVCPPQNVKAKTNNTNTKKFGVLVTDMPLGPLTLSAYLYAHCEVDNRMIDFNVDLNKVTDFDYSEFKYYFIEKLETIQKEGFTPDIIGISALFGTAYDSMIKLAAICRTLFPNSLVVGGGFLPTNMYHQIYADTDDFHALCFGEGERPLVRLVNADDRMKQLMIDGSWITKDKSISEGSSRVGRGLVTLGEKNIKIQEFSHDLIEDLDEIPLPDYELCDLHGYSLNPTINAYPVLAKKGLTFNIMTSRGCPYSCSFCAQDTVHGKKCDIKALID